MTISDILKTVFYLIYFKVKCIPVKTLFQSSVSHDTIKKPKTQETLLLPVLLLNILWKVWYLFMIL